MSDEAPKKKRTYSKRVILPDGRTSPVVVPLAMPMLPTSGADLMALWELPREAWNGTLIKVTRPKYGSQQLELVTETTIEDYSMQSIARNYGPGDYILLLNPGPGGTWKKRESKVPISA